MECYYGCGQEANFLIKSTNKWCCSKSVNSCPEQRRKNSLGVRSKSKLIGKKISEHWKNNDYPLKGKDKIILPILEFIQSIIKTIL